MEFEFEWRGGVSPGVSEDGCPEKEVFSFQLSSMQYCLDSFP